jgi:hypothetical protein
MGMPMEREGVDEEGAVAVLRSASQNHNVKPRRWREVVRSPRHPR